MRQLITILRLYYGRVLGVAYLPKTEFCARISAPESGEVWARVYLSTSYVWNNRRLRLLRFGPHGLI
jgi:hypothetical protein